MDPEAPGPPPPPAVWRAAALFHAAGRRRLEQADAARRAREEARCGILVRACADAHPASVLPFGVGSGVSCARVRTNDAARGAQRRALVLESQRGRERGRRDSRERGGDPDLVGSGYV